MLLRIEPSSIPGLILREFSTETLRWQNVKVMELLANRGNVARNIWGNIE